MLILNKARGLFCKMRRGTGAAAGSATRRLAIGQSMAAGCGQWGGTAGPLVHDGPSSGALSRSPRWTAHRSRARTGGGVRGRGGAASRDGGAMAAVGEVAHTAL